MADDKLRLPTSGGGLVSYQDEYKSKFKLSPILVVILIIFIIIVEFILHKFVALS